MPVSAEFAPVRVGVAGLGRSGLHHIERLGFRDDCRVVALFDDCRAARERAAAARQTMYAEWGGLLGDRNVEVVFLATPPAFHTELTLSALAAGKHVVIETPMCLSVIDADAVLAAAARSGRSVIVAHARRWDEDFRTAQESLTSGELGSPVQFKLINWHYNPSRMPARSLSNENTAAASTETADWHWREHASSGGGALWEFGIHYFDQLLCLASRPPQTVFGRTWSLRGSDSEVGFLAVIAFAGGLMAHVEVDRAAGVPLSTGWMIAGDRGGYAAATRYLPTPQGEVVDLPVEPTVASGDDFYLRLASHIRRGERNPVPADQARGAIVLVEAVRESARSGESVPVGHAFSAPREWKGDGDNCSS